MPRSTVWNDLRKVLKLEKFRRGNTLLLLFHGPGLDVRGWIVLGFSLLVVPVSPGYHFPVVFDNIERVCLHEAIHVSNFYRHLLKKHYINPAKSHPTDNSLSYLSERFTLRLAAETSNKISFTINSLNCKQVIDLNVQIA